MRIAILLLCLLVAGCQSGPSLKSSQSGPYAREKFGSVCSPYADNCW